MFTFDPRKWKRATSKDIKPLFSAFSGEPVYFRASSESVIPGQMVGGCPVFWQLYPDTNDIAVSDLKITDIVFWQELGRKKNAFYWSHTDDGLRMLSGRPNGKPILLSNDFSIHGKFDLLGVWNPKNQKVPLLKVLHKSSFRSLVKTDKHCLAVMLLKANDGGKIYGLAYEDICKMTGFSKDIIASHVKALEKMKLIREVRRKKDTLEKTRELMHLKLRNYEVRFGYNLLEFEGVNLDQYEGDIN